MVEDAVITDNRSLLDLCLCRENTIERVAVGSREKARRNGMFRGNGELLKAFEREAAREVIRQFDTAGESSEADFSGNLPS